MKQDNATLLENKKISSMLSDFETHIETYRASLNKEGVWLFLATLGCWGVTDHNFQFLALIITAFLFGHRIYSKLSDKRPFSKIIRDLEEAISSELEPGDIQKARLDHLTEIRSKKLSVASTLKATPIFLICYTFLGLSLWHLGLHGT